MKASIIMPVYNASSYIVQSVSQILSQPLYDIELLLVDDGSTDMSGQICDGYAAKDERVRVFHEHHAGVAHSRQVGLERSRGEYILYIDADDTVHADMITDMYHKAEETDADVVMCDYEELTHDGAIYRCQQPTSSDGVAILNAIISGHLYGALWNKMMRRDWLLQTGAAFPEKLTMREDLLFLSLCLPHARKISYLPKVYYGYERRNIAALTKNYVDETPQYYIQEALWVKMILGNKYINSENRHRLTSYLFTLAYITLRRNLFDNTLWNQFFGDCPKILDYGKGYKKLLVKLSINGHYCLSSFLRTIISRSRT